MVVPYYQSALNMLTFKHMDVWKQQAVVLTPKVNLTNNSQMNNLQEALWVLWVFSLWIDHVTSIYDRLRSSKPELLNMGL